MCGLGSPGMDDMGLQVVGVGKNFGPVNIILTTVVEKM